MKPNALIILGMLLPSTALFAQGQSLDSLAVGIVPIDSVAILKARKASLEAELNSHRNFPFHETESTTTVIKVLKRKPHTGGAGGLTFGFVSQDMKPIKEMIQRREVEELSIPATDTNSLRIRGLNFSNTIKDREITPTFGVTGYAAFDGGFRIGATARGTVGFFTATRNDSLNTLFVGSGWAGLLLEQAFYPRENITLIAGGHIGAGGVATVIHNEKGNGSGLSQSNDGLNYNTSDSSKTLVAAAPYFLGELHAGSTVSLLPWFHLGAEFTAEFAHSQRGFNWANSFTTVNPGGSLRIIFGRA